jgi:hypothetical protein
MNKLPSKALLEALAVTAELTGTQLSPAAAKMLAHDVAHYPVPQVMGALSRCRKELKGRLSLADIISRLDDGRPGPEEAWAILPKDEAGSIVWCDEMRLAAGVSHDLIRDGQLVAARMAFLEKYRRLVAEARDTGAPVNWQPSLGTDIHGREPALREAVELGRIALSHAQTLLQVPIQISPKIAALIEQQKTQIITG